MISEHILKPPSWGLQSSLEKENLTLRGNEQRHQRQTEQAFELQKTWIEDDEITATFLIISDTEVL